ncbi:hypothetical protein RDI86_02240 [Cellulosimicrobium sp. XJ-DQ-B-000]|uniref:hypothetical protein n=1 Tax=Cellulosimicrobium sp. XJ-DQ-B-000 TaxID=3072182 RepID=UPI002808F25B|nr:hypothetical protein [Cellulosimicrobium sp. XJ-DQ-B-000]MDQ8040661.1 hypothetical protein [Cellulosimicrobium sp. XJ-DQ-B-000]
MKPRLARLMFIDEPATGEPTGGGQPAEQPADNAEPTGTEPADKTAEPKADEPKGDDEPKTFDENYVTKLRNEAAAHRKKAQTAADDAVAELTKNIGKALGLIKDDEPADPAELTKQIESEREAAKSARVELAVFRVAGKHHADADALLDSRSFLNKVKDLDPTADDFASQVDAAVKAVVENNPKLRVVQAATKAGSDLSAGNADPSKGQLTREQLAAMTPSDRLKAAKEGRTRDLLGGK